MEENTKKLLDTIKEKAEPLHPLQKRIIDNALKNLRQAFDSEGSFKSFDDTKFLMWDYAISNAQKEIFALATDRKDKSGYGFSQSQKLLDVQSKAIEKGVKINRVFSVGEEQYKSFAFMEVLRSQLKAGITVWIIQNNVTEYITSDKENDQENFIVVDEKLLYRSFVENNESKNSITLDKEKVKKYVGMYEELMARAHKFTKEDLPKEFKEI